jgi:hypothetical protein
MAFVVHHRVAGITIRTESDVPMPLLEQTTFEGFRAEEGEADVRQYVRQCDPQGVPLPEPEGEERELLLRSIGFPERWLSKGILGIPDARAAIRAHLDHPEHVFIDVRWNRAVICDFLSNELVLLYPPEARDMIAANQHLAMQTLPNFSAVLMHGAGVDLRGRAAVFLARGGGGKTTIALQANGRPVLSDDHLILRQAGTAIYAHGTPLSRITSGPIQTRIGGFFLLEKAPAFDLTSVPPVEVFDAIWNTHLRYGAMLPVALRVRVFDLLLNACYQIPAYRLRFPRDGMDWDAIDAAMG